MRNTLTRWIVGTVAATVMVALTGIGSAVAQQSPVQLAPLVPQEALANRYEPPFSETDFRLGDHQGLRGYFLGGRRDRLK